MKIELHKILLSIICIATMNSYAFGQENGSEKSKDIDAQLAKRAELIKSCMETFSTPIDTSTSDEQKIMAAYMEQRKALTTLGNLRAVEAAPLLAKMIFYNIPDDSAINPTFIDTMFGCVSTLVKIGKPGSIECLKRIINFTDENWENEMDPTLLVLVILRVEGEKATRELFDDFKTSLKNEQQIKNMEKAIVLIDASRDLDGQIQNPYDKLKQEIITAEK
ncbi:MAG: hypothetical protein JXA96_05600 [Sedimentisphaerales bacterium]|nr:hypothetical protein [Sedimentisphaerales bacterium]